MMNALSQPKKSSLIAACDSQRMILCIHPNCNEYFEYKINKKYHSPECKRDFEKIRGKAGHKSVNLGRAHISQIETSPLLQRFAKFLSDGKPHTTMEIITGCGVCNPRQAKYELQHPMNGFEIECKQISKSVWEYTMVGGFENIFRIIT